MPQGRQYGLFLCFWVQGWFPCGRKEGVVMLTCGDLKNLPVLQKIKYLTGDSGLANPVRWTFVPETEKLEPWIHGGELLLLSGALSQRRDFRLGQVLLDAMRLKMAGAVLLVGGSYIQKVPREAIARAIEQDFAIMAIPWNVPLVDIQEAVARAIVMSDTQLTLDNALDFLLQGRISAREYAGFVLAPFLAQEERTCRGLLETLESYFACNGNTIKAAELLFVHRNTVKYRLGQAEAILGCSLSDAGVRLKVQLALYIRSQEQDNGKKV